MKLINPFDYFDKSYLHFKNYFEIYNKLLKKDKKQILFIMGNGPSLGDMMSNETYLNLLRNNHTFGLNAAYRAYEKYNFYPTYFGCFDYVVNESHKEAFENLVLSSNPIQKFFFIGNRELKQKMYKESVYTNDKFVKFNFISGKVNDYNEISKSFDKFMDAGSSGANATQVGLMLGYTKIVLLGCDCNYVEKINEAESYDKNSKNKLIITKTPKSNPNYWFSDYQREGDKYNLPGTDIWQMKSWENISKCCPNKVQIINCSNISKIPYFNKKNICKLIKLCKINDINKLVTFIIKTCFRPKIVERLYLSIRKYYPLVKIIILDDGDNKMNVSILDTNTKYIHKYNNIGLSDGRNILVENVNTEYTLLLDDDFVFYEKTNIQLLLDRLIGNKYDILSARMYDFKDNEAFSKMEFNERIFKGIFYKKDKEFYLETNKTNEFGLYDFTINFFICKTELLIKNKWDKQLKLLEHIDFFYRLKKNNPNIKIYDDKDVMVYHIRDVNYSEKYYEIRHDINEYSILLKKKLNVDKILLNGNIIKG
jgi:hypothetical protein